MSEPFAYYWRIRKWLPERYGQSCRVLARGKLNSALVEFEDGQRVITNRWNLRRRRDEQDDEAGAGPEDYGA